MIGERADREFGLVAQREVEEPDGVSAAVSGLPLHSSTDRAQRKRATACTFCSSPSRGRASDSASSMSPANANWSARCDRSVAIPAGSRTVVRLRGRWKQTQR